MLCAASMPPGRSTASRSRGIARMNFGSRVGLGGGTRSDYATLLHDCLRGDATVFDRGDTVEAAWSLLDPILEVWTAARSAPVPEYAAGSWGPEESDHMLERDGNTWYQPELGLCADDT